MKTSQQRLVRDLRGITGASEKQAVGLLKQARWDPDRAADLFYSGGMQGQEIKPAVNEAQMNGLFDRYRDDEEKDEIQDDGIVRFFADLEVDTQDVLVLIMSWKMKAEQMCIYTRPEFKCGLAEMGCVGSCCSAPFVVCRVCVCVCVCVEIGSCMDV